MSEPVPSDRGPVRQPPRRLIIGLTAIGTIALVVAVVAGFSLRDHNTSATLNEILTKGTDPPPTLPRTLGAGLPSMPVATFDGGTTTLEKLRAGRPALINVWASTCAPCVREMTGLQNLHRQFGTKLTIIGVDSGEPPADGTTLLKKVGATYPQVSDPRQTLTQALGATALPTTVFVDANGKIVGLESGARSEAKFRELITERLKVTP